MQYSKFLVDLIAALLNKDQSQRPRIREILGWLDNAMNKNDSPRQKNLQTVDIIILIQIDVIVAKAVQRMSRGIQELKVVVAREKMKMIGEKILKAEVLAK